MVACADELDGVRLTLSISRALGGGVLMTRVTTQPMTVLDRRLRERTESNEQLATASIKEIAALACDPHAMARVAARQRLEVALERDLGADADAAASQLFERLSVHSDATWRSPPPERAMLRQLLEPVPISALVDAGLAVDLETPENLRAAAQRLTAAGATVDAFTAWCEYARHVTQTSPEHVLSGLNEPAADKTATEILSLRAQLILRNARPAGKRSTPDARGGVLAGAQRIAIIAGGADTMTRDSETYKMAGTLLRRSLEGFDGMLLSGGTSAGLPGLVGEIARDYGLRVVGYVPAKQGDPSLYPVLRETHGSANFSELEPLEMWSDIVASGIDVDAVRVVAFPGGSITQAEMLLARALGARVAWLDPAGTEPLPLEDALPFGADGVLELPVDPMTLRAFVGLPSQLSGCQMAWAKNSRDISTSTTGAGS